MSKYDWLLFLHVTGAFVFFAGMVMALMLSFAALTRERPSEVALFMRLTKVAVIAFGVSFVLLLVFGLWLVDEAGYGYGDSWVIAALILFILSNVFGALGGRRAEPTRELAERLAAAGDQPSAELRQKVRDPVVMFLDYGAAVLGVIVLILMIWKPGAG